MDKSERLARFLAAMKMGLRQDTYGENLPSELWEQYRPQAQAILLLMRF